jgi:hypothetical protein
LTGFTIATIVEVLLTTMSVAEEFDSFQGVVRQQNGNADDSQKQASVSATATRRTKTAMCFLLLAVMQVLLFPWQVLGGNE